MAMATAAPPTPARRAGEPTGAASHAGHRERRRRQRRQREAIAPAGRPEAIARGASRPARRGAPTRRPSVVSWRPSASATQRPRAAARGKSAPDRRARARPRADRARPTPLPPRTAPSIARHGPAPTAASARSSPRAGGDAHGGERPQRPAERRQRGRHPEAQRPRAARVGGGDHQQRHRDGHGADRGGAPREVAVPRRGGAPTGSQGWIAIPSDSRSAWCSSETANAQQVGHLLVGVEHGARLAAEHGGGDLEIAREEVAGAGRAALHVGDPLGEVARLPAASKAATRGGRGRRGWASEMRSAMRALELGHRRRGSRAGAGTSGITMRMAARKQAVSSSMDG